MTDERPKYLFHWLSMRKLEQLRSKAVLEPSWKHFVLDAERMISGTSTCREPMLWNPDEGLPRQPCLILDPTRIDSPARLISSNETYYLTKAVKAAQRAQKDIAPILESARRMRSFSRGGWDEYFIEGPIPLSAVIGIGVEEDEDSKHPEKMREAAAALGLPVLDMTGWEVGDPGIDEVDELVAEMLSSDAVLAP